MLGQLEDVTNLYNVLKEEKSMLDEKLADMEPELKNKCAKIEVFNVKVGNIIILNNSFRCLLKLFTIILSIQFIIHFIIIFNSFKFDDIRQTEQL